MVIGARGRENAWVAASAQGRAMHKKKILIVDDSRTALMMTSMLFDKQHFTILTASGGEEGIAKALAERPDLILLDVMMPKVDGFAVCRRLRQEASVRDVPIIMVTTRGEEGNMEAGYSAGCSDYMTKPVDSVELAAKIANYLGDPFENHE
jgi:DNA-binding response OmpR family regulator